MINNRLSSRVYRRTVTHQEPKIAILVLVISVRIKRSGTVGSFRRSMHNRAGTFKSASSIYDLSNDRYCTVTLGQGSCRDRIGISRPLTVTDLPRLSTTPLFLSSFPVHACKQQFGNINY